jgi:hypothetical protein
VALADIVLPVTERIHLFPEPPPPEVIEWKAPPSLLFDVVFESIICVGFAGSRTD